MLNVWAKRAEEASGGTLREEPVLHRKRGVQAALVVTDADGDEEVVVVDLAQVLDRHDHRRLILRILQI